MLGLQGRARRVVGRVRGDSAWLATGLRSRKRGFQRQETLGGVPSKTCVRWTFYLAKVRETLYRQSGDRPESGMALHESFLQPLPAMRGLLGGWGGPDAPRLPGAELPLSGWGARAVRRPPPGSVCVYGQGKVHSSRFFFF